MDIAVPNKESVAKSVNRIIDSKKNTFLNVGKNIRVDGDEGVVTYVNYGKKFMTAKLNNGQLPEVGKRFMFELTEYVVTNVNKKKNRFSFSIL